MASTIIKISTHADVNRCFTKPDNCTSTCTSGNSSGKPQHTPPPHALHHATNRDGEVSTAKESTAFPFVVQVWAAQGAHFM